MTDTHTHQERAPRRDDRIERPVEGRIIAGVAEGLARRLGVGTGWIRLAFVISALFGGSGILAYVAGWLLMPDERDDESIAQRYIGSIGSLSTWLGVALIASAVFIVIDQTGLISGELLFAAVLIGLGVLLYRGEDDGETPSTPPRRGSDGGIDTVTTPAAAAVDESQTEGPEFENPDFVETGEATSLEDRAPGAPDAVDGGGSDLPPATVRRTTAPRPRVPRQRRERSALGRLTIALLLLVLGGIAAFDAALDVDIAYGVYLASFMIVIGVGLIVGAWVGRARWLIVPGLILLPMFVVVSVLPGRLSGDIGERDISGVQLIDVGGTDEMAIGEFVIDLRDIPPGTDADLFLSLGIGHLVIVIPDDRTVEVLGDVGMGELVIANSSSGGLGVERTRLFGEGTPELTIEADLGIGQLEIERRSASSFGDRGDFSCRPTSPEWPFAGELVCGRSN